LEGWDKQRKYPVKTAGVREEMPAYQIRYKHRDISVVYDRGGYTAGY
jgi:hypothetical protein